MLFLKKGGKKNQCCSLFALFTVQFSLISAGVYEVGGAKNMGKSKQFFLLVNFHVHKCILNHETKKEDTERERERENNQFT